MVSLENGMQTALLGATTEASSAQEPISSTHASGATGMASRCTLCGEGRRNRCAFCSPEAERLILGNAR